MICIKLRYEEVTMENIDFATSIQYKIFPNECGYYHYLNTIQKGIECEKYYIVYDNDIAVGITGTYITDSDKDTIWLGWFGVLAEFRGKGYGRKILIDTIELCKSYKKFKYFRLYTSDSEDATARPLYRSVMQLWEYYRNKNDYTYNDSCMVYSYALDDSPIEKWNDRFLNLKKITQEEKEGADFYNKNEKHMHS